MRDVAWELVVGLSLSRGRNQPGVEGVAVVGDLTGEPPESPTDVTVYAGVDRVGVDGAELQPMEVLGLNSMDYGGVLFSTDGGMAPIDAFASRISEPLQAALQLWYDEWDEATSTDRWTVEGWIEEGHRLGSALQAAMGEDWDIYFDPR